MILSVTADFAFARKKRFEALLKSLAAPLVELPTSCQTEKSGEA